MSTEDVANRYKTKIYKLEDKLLVFKSEREDLERLCAKLKGEIIEKDKEMDQQQR